MKREYPWSILFVGENADSDEEDTFIWKLRDELSEALDQIDLSEVKLKADPNENDVNYWWLKGGVYGEWQKRKIYR